MRFVTKKKKNEYTRTLRVINYNIYKNFTFFCCENLKLKKKNS